MDDVTPAPADRDLVPDTAEMAVLAAAFWQPSWLDTLPLLPAHFAEPIRGALWAGMRKLRVSGTQPDAPAVIAAMGLSGAMAQAMADLLTEVATDHSVASNAPVHAETVIDRAARRHLLGSVIPGARQRLCDVAVPVDEGITFLEQGLAGVAGGWDREADELVTFAEFVSEELPPVEWVIPDLLARGERTIVTGTEGAGKSLLCRTIAVMAAAGLHPFTLRSADPRRVLVVDCENPKRIMHDWFATLGKVAATRGRSPDGLMIRRFPQGIDLGSPEDRMRLRRLCQLANPDLLVIGPVYKMHLGGGFSREEDLARIVASAIDGIREEFGCAVLMEHHVPKGEAGQQRGALAPIGSSLWMRWPEFGFGLAKDRDAVDGDGNPLGSFDERYAVLLPWRGGRDYRPWPHKLQSGGPGGLPWVDPTQLRRP